VSTQPSGADSRAFDVAVLVSITSGVLLVQPFSKVHEACEWLMGHPVWTHELGSEATVNRIKAAVLAQHPDLPSEVTADRNNWDAVAASLRETYGATRDVAKGSGERTASPIETLRQMRPDLADDAIVVVPSPGETR